MRFFFPDSLDLVDPSFDFVTERRSPDRVRQRDDLYAHEVFETPPFDGLLVAAKLIYEQFVGPLPGSAESSGGAVIVASHLYGAITGVMAAVLIKIRAGQPAAI